MQSIIDRIVENLKKELAEFFSEIPSIEAVEEFSWTKLKRPRRKCINAFHYSACKAGEEFWDDVYEQIVSRYDLKGTRISMRHLRLSNLVESHSCTAP